MPLDTADGRLQDVIKGMIPGEEIILTAGGEPVAVVTRKTRTSWPCQPGSAKNTRHWTAPDFDEPLDDFAEYME
jgi:antitoxin (DNA-binding transcriptional repressor) of toxin-antitoxin stability system